MKTKIITFVIAAVWLINGLFCKVLNLVPRHEKIVAKILGNDHARILTFGIGTSEIIMALWILSGYKSRLNAWTQMIVIGTMNLLEFVLAPDLLLWGKFNSLFATLFIALIAYHEFFFKKTQHR